MGISENLCSFLKEVKPLVLYSVEHGIAMEPMKGKLASSRVDLGYTELFCIPEVHQCSSRFVTVFLGTLCVPSKKSRLLTYLIWKTGLLCMECRGIEPHFPTRGMSHRISRVRHEPGLYTRVTLGMAIRNTTLFSEVRTPA